MTNRLSNSMFSFLGALNIFLCYKQRLGAVFGRRFVTPIRKGMNASSLSDVTVNLLSLW